MCYSVLQYDACVAMWYKLWHISLWNRGTWVSVLQCVAVCCRVLQCVAVCCSVLRCVVECYSVLQCDAVCSNVV